MPDANRRFARYPASLRLRLQLPGGELETTTEEVSLAGISAPCTPSPELGTRFGFVLHLPDDRLLSGTAEVKRTAADGVTGFETVFSPAQVPEWEAFIEQERASGGLWRMIGRYAANQGQEKEAARSVLERGPLGILFKRLGPGPSPAEAEAPPVVTRLHMVGENGEAFRIAFEKHPGCKPEDSELCKRVPEFLELARVTVARILPEDVYLKRSPQARILPTRVVELLKGGFGAVALHPTAPPSLVGLHGAELIAIEIDGQSVFPFYQPPDLDRIALDDFRRDPERVRSEPKPTAAPLRDRFASSYEHRELTTREPAPSSLGELREAIASARRVQTRSYGSRTIRLFPELWLEVLRPAGWSGPVRGFALEDGLQLCVFVLVGQDAPRVVALEPTDALSIIRGDAQS